MNASIGNRARHFDWLTVASIAALAYVLSTALHEHGGHAAACVALGGRVSAFGAYYVDCDYRTMSSIGVKWVALAGPLASLASGFVFTWALRKAGSPLARLLCWALASVGLMTAFGYMLFSAVADIGDLGTGPDGALHGVAMPWLWRIAMGGGGYWLYDRSVVWSMRRLAELCGGFDERPRRVARIALTCYLAGGATGVLIGLFNPLGIVIVLTSALASSLGGTSGFAWGPYRTRVGAGDVAATAFPRSWPWIVVSLALVLAYGVVFGPSIVR